MGIIAAVLALITIGVVVSSESPEIFRDLRDLSNWMLRHDSARNWTLVGVLVLLFLLWSRRHLQRESLAVSEASSRAMISELERKLAWSDIRYRVMTTSLAEVAAETGLDESYISSQIRDVLGDRS